jgi:DNA polymerase-3 subunit gamma/tau
VQASTTSIVAAPVMPDPTSTRTHGALALKVVTPSPAPVAPVAAVPPPPPPPALAPQAHQAQAQAPAPATAPARAAAPPPAAALPPVASLPLADLNVWRAILDRVRAKRPALASTLEHAIPLETTAARVVLGFEPSAAFLAARASEPEALDDLTREIRAHFGAPTRVELDLSARASGAQKTVASVDAERRTAELAKARAAVENHPLVQEAVRLFGAQLRDVKLPSGEG